MCWRRNNHSEKHQAAVIRMVQLCYETGTDVCRQAELQANIERTFQGAVKCCVCASDREKSRLLLCQKGRICARLSRITQNKHPFAGNG